jgi:hypothetical protein
MPTLPFKLNQDRRHRIPRQQRHKVTNWPAYDAALRGRANPSDPRDCGDAVADASRRVTKGGKHELMQPTSSGTPGAHLVCVHAVWIGS